MKLGTVLTKQGKHRKAVKAYQQSIQLEPITSQDPGIKYRLLGWAYQDLHDYAKMAEAFKQAMLLDQNEQTYYGLGVAYLNMDCPQAAINISKQAVQLYPNDADMYNIMGRAYMALDDQKAALEQYRILKTLDSHMAEVLFEFIDHPSFYDRLALFVHRWKLPNPLQSCP
jgi:tetratricopeptide (TPR) repeat protein